MNYLKTIYWILIIFYLVDALAKQNLDYIHVSVGNFWNGSLRNAEDTKSRVLFIKERVGDKVPVIGIGGFYTPE